MPTGKVSQLGVAVNRIETGLYARQEARSCDVRRPLLLWKTDVGTIEGYNGVRQGFLVR